MQINTVYYPNATVEIFTETKRLVLSSAISGQVMLNNDILSINTLRSLASDSPTFSINAVYREEWENLIGSNDLVVIKMQRPPEKLSAVLVGLVDDCRKNNDYSQEQPQRILSVSGRGFAKAFVDFDIGVVSEVELSEGYLGYLGKEVTLENCAANEAINQLITTYVDNYINYSFADGTTLYKRLQLSLSSNPTYTVLDVSSILNYQGSLWNLMKEIQNAPFNEMFFEIKNDNPVIIMRETPFNENTWANIESTTVRDVDLVKSSLGRSDIETYTLYSVNCSVMYSGGNSNTSFGYVPLWYEPYFSKYGIKRLSVTSLYAMYAGSTDAEDANLKTMKCTYDLFNWNILNNKMYNGFIVVKGSNKYHLGMKITLEEDNRTYYVESVQHVFNIFGTWQTKLGLTRGMKETDRFKEPFGKGTAFDASVFGITASDHNSTVTGTGDTVISTSAIVNKAQEYLGSWYAWGGTTPPTKSGGTWEKPHGTGEYIGGQQVMTPGFDCSGYMWYLFKQFGYDLPRTSQEQANVGETIDKDNKDLWKPGDLLFYSPHSSGPSHVGMYIGNGKRIHSPHTGDVIKIDNAGSPCAVKRIGGATNGN